MKRPWLFLLGPTAVGKSEIAIELALILNGEIISADSMQIYRGMDIGTAKPSMQERRGVVHHLFDVLDIEQTCDVGLYRKLACEVIADIESRKKHPLVVGGSGMYVRALSQGFLEGPGRNEKLREKLENLNSTLLRERLLQIDPVAGTRINLSDRRRMIRAIEFYYTTGKSISESQIQWSKEEKQTATHVQLIGLNRPREELYRRSDIRVELMFEKGWVEEVRGLMKCGLAESPTSSKAIGYPEIMRLLAGGISENETMALVKQRTRHFIKRQLSWFRREPGIHWLDLSDEETPSKMAHQIKEICELQNLF